jgi:archaeal holliday junction resolvase (hjc)|nr:MAG TPA: Nuclease [Caudoviricetes sp.]
MKDNTNIKEKANLKEKAVENKIKKWLKDKGYWFFKVHGSIFQPAGIPDILACINGKFVAIEVKRTKGGVVSPLQKAQIEKIKENGGIAGVANSMDEFLEILKEGELL